MKKQALLIGINQYQILPELKFARQDAESVEQALKQNYCFTDDEVMLLTDARSGLLKPTNSLIILSHLEKLANQELDLFIFGFWGHGVVRNGKRYLCPLDVMPSAVEKLGVPFDELMNLLSKIRAKNTCLILDCCQKVHDRGDEETLTAADQAAIENAARDIVLRRKETAPEFVSNVAILNSCKEGQAAYEWDNRKHGIFTAHLLDAMNRRFDSVAQIVGYVNHNVEKTAMELGKTQTPLCRLEGDIPLPVDTKSTPLVTGNVFISYRHCNADLVAPVEEELKRRSISYFIDRVGVNYGMEYSEALTQALKASKILLLFWTKDAIGSTDLFREVKMALDLKKRVIPYKIGSFNVIEHDSLYYQLSPLSRYEVPTQTPETVKEIVNRVELALKGKAYQQYSFTLPEKSQDAVIQKPEIEDINVTFTPELIEQSQLIQYNEIQLPSLSEDLLKIQAENRGLQTAIEQLKAFTHESLTQANSAVAQAQAQFDAWSERKERLWKDLSRNVRQSLEMTISNNPECTEKDVSISTEGFSYQQYFDFLEQFQCGKKCEQAKQELERVKWEREIKCNEAIAKFQQQIEHNNSCYRDRSGDFFDEAVMTIFAVMPGYDDVYAPFPEDSILDPMRQLDKYELGWRPDRSMDRARKLWAEKRPCVVKAITEKQQQKQQKIEIEIEKEISRIEKENSRIEKEKIRNKWIMRDVVGVVGLVVGVVGFVVLLISSYMSFVENAKVKRTQKELKQKISMFEPGQYGGERQVITINDVEFAFRWCPAGTFMMGSPESEKGRNDDEIQHQVTLTKGFWMLETEITQKQWKTVMGNNSIELNDNFIPRVYDNREDFSRDNFPIEYVSWDDCQKFCFNTGLQLPTEAQWEYACRAGSTGSFSGNLDEIANYGGYNLCPVKTKNPNAWGLYDMHGNVSEWCQDWYGDYSCMNVTNPTGPSSGNYHVYRGGGCNRGAKMCRSATRNASGPIGFRCVINQ